MLTKTPATVPVSEGSNCQVCCSNVNQPWRIVLQLTSSPVSAIIFGQRAWDSKRSYASADLNVKTQVKAKMSSPKWISTLKALARMTEKTRRPIQFLARANWMWWSQHSTQQRNTTEFEVWCKTIGSRSKVQTRTRCCRWPYALQSGWKLTAWNW